MSDVVSTNEQSPAPVAGRPLTAEADPIEPCGGCGETNPSRRCLGCLHDFVSRPASDQPVEASGAGRDGPEVGDDAVEKILSAYLQLINSTPDLLSILYDADLMPEQTTTVRGAICVAAVCEAYKAALSPASLARPELTVWYGKMPESNGRENWTALLRRVNPTDKWDQGFCFARSEYPGRVLYEADRVRWIIGERAERPDILAYDADAHSGYVEPASPARTPMGVLDDPTDAMIAAGLAVDWTNEDERGTVINVWYAMKALEPAAPTPMGEPAAWRIGDDGAVYATLKAARNHVDGWRLQGAECSDPQPLYDRQALAASSPSPAQGGEQIARKAELYDHMREVAAANGFDSLTQAIAEAYAARQAVSASPQPEAGEARPTYRITWEDDATNPNDRRMYVDGQQWAKVYGWNKASLDARCSILTTAMAAPPSVQPVEGK